MHAVIANHIGRIHHAAGQADLQLTRPTYAFVPEECISANAFDHRRYISGRWPSVNAGANPHAIGSHVMPDPERPVDPLCQCPVLAEFLTRIEPIALVKIPHKS